MANDQHMWWLQEGVPSWIVICLSTKAVLPPLNPTLLCVL